MRLPRLLPRVLVLVLITVAVTGTGTAVAGYSSAQAFVTDINHARAHHAMREYVQRRDLAVAARRWAAWMAAHHTLKHNPALGSNVCCWRDLGENVGRGPTERALHRAFMASPEHRSNILSRTFTQVGVGTARSSDGRLYVDELFRRPDSSYATSPNTATAVAGVPVARTWSPEAVLRRRFAASRSTDAVGESLVFVGVMRAISRFSGAG